LATYELTQIDREKAHSAEARAKAKETWALKRSALEDYVLDMWEQGMGPLAVATKAHSSVETVAKIIREADHEIPTYLTTVGGKVSVCSCCGRSQG
jgi:hypothetical protein